MAHKGLGFRVKGLMFGRRVCATVGCKVGRWGLDGVTERQPLQGSEPLQPSPWQDKTLYWETMEYEATYIEGTRAALATSSARNMRLATAWSVSRWAIHLKLLLNNTLSLVIANLSRRRADTDLIDGYLLATILAF